MNGKKRDEVVVYGGRGKGEDDKISVGRWPKVGTVDGKTWWGVGSHSGSFKFPCTKCTKL